MGSPRDDAPDADGQDGPEPRGGLLRGTSRLGLVGEVGMVGVLVLLLSLPVVTAVPAVAAGALHLRRHLCGDADSASRLLRGFGSAVAGLWALGIAVPAVLALAGLNIWLTWSGALPGGPLIGAVSVGIGLVVGVVTLRTAGAWYPGASGLRCVRDAAWRAGHDAAGSALLVVAVLLCGTLVWLLEALVLLVGGLLALAAVAVEHRWAAGGAADD